MTFLDLTLVSFWFPLWCWCCPLARWQTVHHDLKGMWVNEWPSFSAAVTDSGVSDIEVFEIPNWHLLLLLLVIESTEPLSWVRSRSPQWSDSLIEDRIWCTEGHPTWVLNSWHILKEQDPKHSSDSCDSEELPCDSSAECTIESGIITKLILQTCFCVTIRGV